jgi:hypothetical protein
MIDAVEADRGLFQALATMRSERSSVNVQLNETKRTDQSSRESIDHWRDRGEKGYLAAIDILAGRAIPGLADLRAAHDTVAALRLRADTAVTQSLDQRPADLLKDWPVKTQLYLTSRQATAAAGTQEVSSNGVGVFQAAAETGSAAAQVLFATKSLAKETHELKGSVEDFLSDVRVA